MTLIRITGNEEECRRIQQAIEPVIPTILEVQTYPQRDGGFGLYITVMEPLQEEAGGDNTQDWAIIEYCKQYRSTPDIKKYFNLEYEQVREICDRLYSSGALSRRLNDKGKAYEYIDRGQVHCCKECRHLNPSEKGYVIATCDSRGEISFTHDWELSKLRICEWFKDKQERIE